MAATEREKSVFRKAFLVIGPESSGTRVTTKVLIENGCFGSDKHFQPMDGFRDPSLLDPYDFVVIRRSVPHNKYYPDMNRIYDYYGRAGFEYIHTIVTTRHWPYIAESQVSNRFAGCLSEAILSVQLAYKLIFSNINMPYTVSSYTDLVSNPEDYQKWLCAQINLPFIRGINIVDGDAKYKKI